MSKENTSLEGWLVRLSGLVCGGVSVVAAFRNGQLIGSTGFDGLMFGAAGVAVVVMSWFLPNMAASAWARREKIRAVASSVLWVVTATFTLVQAVGYSAHNRVDTVEHKREAQRQAKDARQHLVTAESELATMKANDRWKSTAGCSNATVDASKAFCGQVTAKAKEVADARARASVEAPGSVDAQAETLAWATGINATWIASAMPVLMAIVFELAAGLSFFAAPPAMAKPVVTTIDHEAPSVELKTIPRQRGANGRFLPKGVDLPAIGHDLRVREAVR